MSLGILYLPITKTGLSTDEGLSSDAVAVAINDGPMVLLDNPAHQGVILILMGQPCRIKVNANIDSSSLNHCLQTELEKT